MGTAHVEIWLETFAACGVEQMGDKEKCRSATAVLRCCWILGLLSNLLVCPVPVRFVSSSYRARLGGKEGRGRRWNRDRRDMPCM
jgi:hypothetical protein